MKDVLTEIKSCERWALIRGKFIAYRLKLKADRFFRYQHLFSRQPRCVAFRSSVVLLLSCGFNFEIVDTDLNC